jgi:hypothetical protein
MRHPIYDPSNLRQFAVLDDQRSFCAMAAVSWDCHIVIRSGCPSMQLFYSGMSDAPSMQISRNGSESIFWSGCDNDTRYMVRLRCLLTCICGHTMIACLTFPSGGMESANLMSCKKPNTLPDTLQHYFASAPDERTITIISHFFMRKYLDSSSISPCVSIAHVVNGNMPLSTPLS